MFWTEYIFYSLLDFLDKGLSPHHPHPFPIEGSHIKRMNFDIVKYPKYTPLLVRA